MPRTADHDERRRQLSAAATEIALDHGLERLTVARVAKVAGVSVGLVQHYFPGKDLLMQRVYADLLTGIDERVVEVVEAGERRGLTIRRMAEEALSEFLPIDPPRRAECRVRAEFQALAARSEALTAVARVHDQALRARLRKVVDNAKDCGETPDDADSAAVADHLWVEVVGIAATALLDPGFDAVRLLAEAAAGAFPHPCRHK